MKGNLFCLPAAAAIYTFILPLLSSGMLHAARPVGAATAQEATRFSMKADHLYVEADNGHKDIF